MDQGSHFDELHTYHLADEQALIDNLCTQTRLDEKDRAVISDQASALIEHIRTQQPKPALIEALLQQYGLSSHEGVLLMRLAESLIRVPDNHNAMALLRDKLQQGQWHAHRGQSPSFLVNRASDGLAFSAWWSKISQTGARNPLSWIRPLGDPLMLMGFKRAMAMMGRHFVMGSTIEKALDNAADYARKGFTCTFDMLGEAAHTAQDAERYFQAYMRAAKALHGQKCGHHQRPHGISVKLSALHPRYEYRQAAHCLPVLHKRLLALCLIAKQAGINITIDAEESDRLELSLILFEQLLQEQQLAGWNGLGIVVQAYSRRAMASLDHIIALAQKYQREIPVRLVKGAYWDMEIKRAQQMGLESYPVFTRKENSDVSYIACARKMLDATPFIQCRFATHNAHTACAVIHMAGDRKDFEFQCLFGMGDALHGQLIANYGITSRIYAPVGRHKDLLPYLVRRLLENGANSSFVNQLTNRDIPAAQIAADPIAMALANQAAQNPSIINPCDQFSGDRLAAKGLDNSQANAVMAYKTMLEDEQNYNAYSIIGGKDVLGQTHTILCPASTNICIGHAHYADAGCVTDAIKAGQRALDQILPLSQRAEHLQTAANMLEEQTDMFTWLLVKEAGKHWDDAIAEIREAVDFLRYYANHACSAAMADRQALGIVACISPWNFPLAIFLGQVSAAYAAGNSVIAKPAEQTPLIAYQAITLLHNAGVPADAISLIIGDGAQLGHALSAHRDVHGIAFTGSTITAKKIAHVLSQTQRENVPLIAETGGINAMIIDSTALHEQAVSDVISSAFQSAGQRCSACRLVCVQDDIADTFLHMLDGAMQELRIGDTNEPDHDIGPVIDANAHNMLWQYIGAVKAQYRTISEAKKPSDKAGHFITPIAVEIPSISVLEKEVFGPVLHIYRYQAHDLDKVMEEITALGFGLTMGLHSRIENRVDQITRSAQVGNLYVNRNQIGAVVGVQPFGGEGLSGTGPKAGGPNYMLRLSRPRNWQDYQAHSGGFSYGQYDDEARLCAKKILHDAKRSVHHTLSADDKERILHGLTGIAEYFQGKDTTVLQAFTDAATFYADSLCKAQILPGPTGEDNRLFLYPRGIILCCGGASFAQMLQQIAKALAGGNIVIASLQAHYRDELADFAETLQAIALPKGHLHLCSEKEACALIDMPIDAVACDDGNETIFRHILQREGAIMPMLTSQDDHYRYCTERTVTIDTTAAGGNASLLAKS